MQHLPRYSRIYNIAQSMLLKRTMLMERFASHCSWLNKIYYNGYYKYVTKEIGLANIDAKTKVLHIGGGRPYTAVIITRSTGAQVTVVEIDPKIRDMAVAYIEKLGLEDKIGVILADGRDISVSGFDVVILSLSIKSKDAVLTNIFETCDPWTSIIYRSARKSLETVYEDSIILSKYAPFIRKTIYHCGISLKASHLLVPEVQTKKELGFK